MTSGIRLSVTILGSGTSTGVPTIGCDCEVCTGSYTKNKRSRASALITREDTGDHIVIDTTPEFRIQMLKAGVRRLGHVLYTHTHADHSHGFDDLRAFYFHSKKPVRCYMPAEYIPEFKDRFSYAFTDTGYMGTTPQVDLVPVPEKNFEVLGLDIEPVRLPHGSVQTTGFRIGSFAYCTDFKGFPEETLQKWRGKVHTMVASGVHFKNHPTHNNVQETVKLFEDLEVKRGFITHLAHQVCYERDSEKLPERASFAYDGLRFSVTT